MPEVSVVIPTYNQSQYIREALESVFKQAYTDYEIVVIDDGSTDNTKKIVENYMRLQEHPSTSLGTGKDTRTQGHKDTRAQVRYFYQENKGRGSARQLGVNESKGDYIAFLDSDDKWFPEKLEKQMAYIKKNNFSGLLHTRIVFIDKNGNKFKKMNRVYKKLYDYKMKNGFSYTSLLHDCTLFLSTAIMPKKLILQLGGFRERYKTREDVDFILRLVRTSKIELLDEELVFYRSHPGSTFGTDKKRIEREYLSIFKEQLRNINVILNPIERKDAEQYIYKHLINFSYDLGDKHNAFKYMKEFIRKQPLQILRMRQFKNILKLLKWD